MANIVAIIVAAGTGERMKVDGDESLTSSCSPSCPKQYMKIANKALIVHSASLFKNNPKISSVICVIHPDHHDLYETHMGEISSNLIAPIYGGASRQESVKIALQHLNTLNEKPDIVIIHDAARPMISDHHIESVLELIVSDKTKGATLAVEVSDTYRRGFDNGGCINAGSFIDRSNLYAIQTPQAFRFDELLNAHETTQNPSHTDDTSLMTEAGHEITLAKGCAFNIKVTSPSDIKLVELFLQHRDLIT